ncbi:hypothetical protein EVAR_47320_1 [Eumeta japonica]|uniref:Uncharacterized protein n=1 Tax=Eumeta variegata TaxID=151549 RepID=A0A4C1YJ35_EUMVA|nr:hypothetical protein EVAR_47320_1 [Eumeta japonica]
MRPCRAHTSILACVHRRSFNAYCFKELPLTFKLNSYFLGRVRPLSLFYSDASADGVEEKPLVPRSRSHARLRRNATMSHAFPQVDSDLSRPRRSGDVRGRQLNVCSEYRASGVILIGQLAHRRTRLALLNVSTGLRPAAVLASALYPTSESMWSQFQSCGSSSSH